MELTPIAQFLLSQSLYVGHPAIPDVVTHGSSLSQSDKELQPLRNGKNY
jgi:hypothetical protein